MIHVIKLVYSYEYFIEYNLNIWLFRFILICLIVQFLISIYEYIEFIYEYIIFINNKLNYLPLGKYKLQYYIPI